MRKTHPTLFLAIFWSLLTSSAAYATGFEKPIVISGKYGGVAGAAVSSVEGEESLLFNPAGLAGAKGVEATLDVSPFLTQKQGPVTAQVGSATTGAGDKWGQVAFAAPIGVFGVFKLGEKLGIGLGYFAVAGGGGGYGPVDFGTSFPNLHPDSSGALAFNDFSIGAGYELIPGLRLGAAWRVTFIQGYTHAGAVIPFATPILYALSFDNLSATNYTGFRVGGQYVEKSGKWGLGVNFRSMIEFTATGSSSAQAEISGQNGISQVPGGAVTETSALPWQLAVGGHYRILDPLRILAEYDFTYYNMIQNITYGGAGVGPIDPSTLTLNTQWLNLHSFRLGADTTAGVYTLRAGYALLTQVTPANHANYGMIPPGLSHTVTFGAGRGFLKEDALHVDLAMDLSMVNGVGYNSTPGFLDGDYILWATTLHSSVSYRF